MSATLIWFQKNLRIHDNEALWQACQNSDTVIGVYCIDPRDFELHHMGFKKTEKYRAKFILETLADLQKSLSALNIPLLIFQDKPEAVLPRLIKDYQISEVFHQHEWTHNEALVFQKIVSNVNGVTFFGFYDQCLIHPDDYPFEVPVKLPEVFTIYRKKTEQNLQIRPLNQIPSKRKNHPAIESSTIPSLLDLGFADFKQPPHSAFPFQGGETDALKRLSAYLWETQNIGSYKQTRNGLLGTEYSSKFSAWLAIGALSPKKIYWELQLFENKILKNEDTYWMFFELLWREYFKLFSMKHGTRIFQLHGIKSQKYHGNQSKKAFDLWKQGNTDENFINANMLELQNTGWMSNRGRQNAASFWSKTWEQDWRIGAAYFEAMLIDYDVHSNYGNWMYIAGVGNDPRDRRFSIQKQAAVYDPKGLYQNTWISN